MAFLRKKQVNYLEQEYLICSCLVVRGLSYFNLLTISLNSCLTRNYSMKFPPSNAMKKEQHLPQHSFSEYSRNWLLLHFSRKVILSHFTIKFDKGFPILFSQIYQGHFSQNVDYWLAIDSFHRSYAPDSFHHFSNPGETETSYQEVNGSFRLALLFARMRSNFSSALLHLSNTQLKLYRCF
ncbi:hypothetical protein FGO68_gene1566 [Halteria grandinella]|uniref:Uncharacterized protein n=1 Tax=Halteria grandinella TaxID=5974 RepID=A0A8J8NGR9_HALGN|nr:hypothetical protein FGO68_gene1566 [Halteria grandinella]